MKVHLKLFHGKDFHTLVREERIKNFWYKVSTIENFNNVSSSLESA